MAKFALVNSENIVENIIEASESYGNDNGWIYADGFSIAIGDSYEPVSNKFYRNNIEIIKIPGLDPNSVINSFKELYDENVNLREQQALIKAALDELLLGGAI